MFLPLYLLQLTGILAISFSNLEDKDSSESLEYPSVHLNNIYKKKEIIPVEIQDQNENDEKHTENQKSQRVKKEYSEKNNYFSSNDLGIENWLHYPYSLLNKFRQSHDYESFLNSETTHPSISVESNQEKTEKIEQKNGDLNQLFKFCYKTIRDTMLLCIKILRNNNFKLPNNRCVNTNLLEDFMNCQNSSIYSFIKNYLNEQNTDGIKKTMLIEKRNSIPKRLPFHAWGGKRANQVGTEKIQASRVPFNAWGGKRSNSQAPDEGEIAICCTETNSLSYNPYKIYKGKILDYNN